MAYTQNYCRRCTQDTELSYGIAPCPFDGGFGVIGTHRYNIHVTAVTYKCQCGSIMGRFASRGSDKEVDPFGACPVR